MNNTDLDVCLALRAGCNHLVAALMGPDARCDVDHPDDRVERDGRWRAYVPYAPFCLPASTGTSEREALTALRANLLSYAEKEFASKARCVAEAAATVRAFL